MNYPYFWTADPVQDLSGVRGVRYTGDIADPSLKTKAPNHTSNNVEATLSNATSRTISLRHCCRCGTGLRNTLRGRM